MCSGQSSESFLWLTTNYFRIKRRNDTISFITEWLVAKRNVQPFSKEKCTVIACNKLRLVFLIYRDKGQGLLLKKLLPWVFNDICPGVI